MKLNKLLLGLGTVAAVALPITTIVACGDNNDTNKDPIDTHKSNPHKVNSEQKSTVVRGKWTGKTDINYFDKATPEDWASKNYFDAKIVKWIDGDTPIVDVTGGTSTLTGRKNLHIRVSGIDTPELHVFDETTGKIDKETTGTEFKYADAARIWADKQMPVGSTIRVTTNGSVSYDRIVGHIFYGQEFKKNFEVGILKTGLALPFITDGRSAVPTTNWQHYAYREMADAYNFAVDNKLGIFEGDSNDVTKTHGSTSVSIMLDYGSDDANSAHHSIYAYTKDLN